MNPRESEQYLFRLKRHGIKTGFERAHHLLEELGNPHKEFTAVQVGGTNGKGSTARMVESCLRQEGRKTGLYTSPHMTELGERIRVDGDKMRRKRIKDFVDDARPVIEQMDDKPTFFEATTVMALYEFMRRGVDTAVLEVGLGGRFDTTGVCDTSVSAITSISLEHTDILGESIEDVAWEIGHVIPKNGVCVTAATNAIQVLNKMAGERNADLHVVDEDITYTSQGREGLLEVFDVQTETDYMGLRSPILGSHQVRNAGVAVGVLEELGIGEHAIREGLLRAEWPGRFEVMQQEPMVVLDAAHNPAGIRALVDTIQSWSEGAHVVFGAMQDKDISGMAEELSRVMKSVVVTSPSKSRAEDTDVLAGIFRDIVNDVTEVDVVAEAVEHARSRAEGNDVVLVTGSLYTVGEARRVWVGGGVGKTYVAEESARESLMDLGTYTASYADKAVHRSVRLKGVPPETADELERLATSVGAEAVASARVPGMYVDIEVMGTLSQHRDIAEEFGMEWLKNQLLTPTRTQSGGTDVMGILNVTPDSFYDGGKYQVREDAVERGIEMVEEGADIIDVGGESTRPGAKPVAIDEEIQRVIPVIKELVQSVDVPVSVDTRNPEVARLAIDEGASIINDVSGLEHPSMRDLAAETGCRVVVMDAVDVPVKPNRPPIYDDVVMDVIERLLERVTRARRAGIDPNDIILDPGIGFGKGSKGDIELLRRTEEFVSLGYPVLIGCSRKSFLEDITGLPKEERLEASVAANVIAASKGASIVRVHDVKETVRAIEVSDTISSTN